MKIIQEGVKFEPIIITIESEVELAELYLLLNKSYTSQRHIKSLYDYLFDKNIMNASVAKKILDK